MTATIYIHTDNAILGQIFLFLEMVLFVIFSAKILQNRLKKSAKIFYKHTFLENNNISL